MKKIFLAIILFVTNGNLYAQGVKMRDVFSQMPDTLLPYLSQNNKLDMMDFMESGMTADIVNGFDEHTCMTTLTDDYIRISLSPASSIEMKLLSTDKMLPDSADCILCMVRTVGTVQKSSTVRFYTSKWTEIKTIPDPMAGHAESTIVHPDTMDIDEFEKLKLSLLSPRVVYASLSESENTLTIGISPSVLSIEDKTRIKPLLNQTTLKWNGSIFKEG